jgi:hypothetical protein
MTPRCQQKNFTRRSHSIPRRLLREGAPQLVAAYYLLRLSDLGREGSDHSGSYRFADHIYRGTPSGRTILGRWIDARLLGMPAARAFRRRYERAQDVIRGLLETRPPGDGPLRVLAVPCGIPRDILDLAATLHVVNPALLARLEYHGLDIDAEVVELARELTRACGLRSAHIQLGNALVQKDYPATQFHLVVSTGLGEFLSDDELAAFYTIVYGILEPGGTLYTSATARDPRSDTLLRMVELVTQYRRASDVELILRRLPWSRVVLAEDETGLQTFVTAVK